MSNIFRIKATPLGIQIPAEPNGNLVGFPLININPLFKQLAEMRYSNVVRQVVVERKYYQYIANQKLLYAPRYMLRDIETLCGSKGVRVVVDELPVQQGVAVDIPMIDGFSPISDLQAGAIDYAAGETTTAPMRPIAIQTGGGKALTLDTPVKIPGGWKRMGDVKVGDLVTSVSGTPSRVTNVFPQGVTDVYRVLFADGRYVDTCGEHLWTVKWDFHWAVIDTLEIQRRLAASKTVSIPLSIPENTPDVSLPYPPYRIGYDLGRGVIDILPDNLMDASPSQKRDVVRGLTAAVSGLEIDLPSNEIARCVQELIWSLGGIAEVVHTRISIQACNYRPTLDVVSVEQIDSAETQCISIDHPEKLYVVKDYIVTHNTATAIAAISKIGRRAMICVPFMIDDWVEAIKGFTKLTDDDIYVIQGIQSFAKLMAGINKKLNPKVIVASIPTLREYREGSPTYQNFPNFDTLCDHLGVGVRVIDEAHLNFSANLALDIRLNNAVTIPLTATFDSSSQIVIGIFDLHYPKESRYGEKNYDRYVDIFAYAYSLGASIPNHCYRGKDGYSHIKLEAWLLSKKGRRVLDEIIDRVFIPLIHSHYMNKAESNEKLLFLCSLQEMCRHLRDVFRERLADRTVEIFIGGSSIDILKEYDIILSTPRSAGTGRDIKQLRTTITTVSVRSTPLNKQMLGRLRKLKSGNVPEYVYPYCTDIPPQIAHAEHREFILKPLAREFHQFVLP